jgi:peroxiredoxin
MEKLHRELKEKDFAMVTISIQESATVVRRFFNRHNLTFTALLDLNGKSVPAFGIRAIPTTLILDKTGRIIGRAMGSRKWDSLESIVMFKRLVETPVST